MASFKFILKFKKSKKTGKKNPLGRVHLLYTHDSKTCEFSTGQAALSKHWNKLKGEYKVIEGANDLNEVLDTFKKKVNKVVTDLQKKEVYPDPETVKQAYEKSIRESLPESVIVQSMNHLWKGYIKYLEETPSELTGDKRAARTISSNENSRETFEAFLSENKIESIQPKNFTLAHFHKWQAYLQKAFPSSNSRSKRQKHFKAYLRHSKKLGYPIGFDTDEIKPKERPGPKLHIDEEELKVFESKELIGRKDLIRDLIIIGCNVGLRISDFKRLDKNIQGSDIVIQTQKTSEPLKIPIVPKVKALLEKYGNQLPAIPEPVFRREVKELFEELFPEKKLQIKVNGVMTTVLKSDYITPHSFIRSFVSISASKGMAVPLIAKITGKSIQVLLKHYLNASQEQAGKAMLEVWGEAPMKANKTA
jgi:hypothetical protein